MTIDARVSRHARQSFFGGLCHFESPILKVVNTDLPKGDVFEFFEVVCECAYDFQKAFVKVLVTSPHRRLSAKVSTCGVDGWSGR